MVLSLSLSLSQSVTSHNKKACVTSLKSNQVRIQIENASLWMEKTTYTYRTFTMNICITIVAIMINEPTK